jgi:hypothetical protein
MEFVICVGPTDGPGATQAQLIQAVNADLPLPVIGDAWCSVPPTTIGIYEFIWLYVYIDIQ